MSKCAEVNVKLNPHALSPLWPDSSNKTGYGMMGPYDAWQDMLGKSWKDEIWDMRMAARKRLFTQHVIVW